ncbi:MAG: hypothetical protein HW414_958 [Dehalococcoidia bacterium]|nr:hypothetical protein [Dehalococcoidia bacterium]
MAWKVEGDYFENCNCDVMCPCVFTSDPTKGVCDLGVAWHIEQGQFDGTRLNGLNVALVVRSPGNMVKVKWEVALYIDQRANAQQAEALGKVFSGQAGGVPAALTPFIGKVLGVKQVPIQFKLEEKTRSVSIPGILEMEVAPVKGGDPKQDPYLVNPPLGITPGFPMYVAASRKGTYSDYGKRWDNAGKNGFFAKFAYSW